MAGEAELLRGAGHEVLEHHVRNPEGGPATFAAVAMAPWNPAAAAQVRAAVRRFRPDVAHVHNTWFRLSPSVIAAVHEEGIPVVMTLHNFRVMCVNGLLFRDGRVCEDCVGTHPWHGVQHSCYRNSRPLSAVAAATIALGRARHVWDGDVDRFIAPSTFTANKVAGGGIPAEKITVKPHGVDDPGERPEPPSRSSTVLYVGRLSPEKGLSVLVDAWQRVAPESLELVVVGEGPQRMELEARRVSGVRFVGYRRPDDVCGLMLTARALMFPSIWYESFALTVVEALAAGLPVMAGDMGSAADVVRTVDPEWLVSPAGVDGWAAALRYLQTSESVDVAGKRARALYEARYTPGRSVERLVAIYQEVVSARRTAR